MTSPAQPWSLDWSKRPKPKLSTPALFDTASVIKNGKHDGWGLDGSGHPDRNPYIMGYMGFQLPSIADFLGLTTSPQVSDPTFHCTADLSNGQ
jgi:hypothetical protein